MTNKQRVVVEWSRRCGKGHKKSERSIAAMAEALAPEGVTLDEVKEVMGEMLLQRLFTKRPPRR